MATRAKKVVGARVANKAARATRREEIITRWNKRQAERLFVEEFDKSSRPLDVLESLLHFKTWTTPQEMLELVSVTPSVLRLFIDHLVRVIELKEMAYEDYLKTPEWAERATKAKARYGGACALDATHSAEHAHHRTYERRGRERKDDLVPLCGVCHRKFHNR